MPMCQISGRRHQYIVARLVVVVSLVAVIVVDR